MNFSTLRAAPKPASRRRPNMANVLRLLAVGLSAVGLTACASTIAVPVAGPDHPANANAPEAPESPRSTALDTEVIAAPKPAAMDHDMHQHHHH